MNDNIEGMVEVTDECIKNFMTIRQKEDENFLHKIILICVECGDSTMIKKVGNDEKALYITTQCQNPDCKLIWQYSITITEMDEPEEE